MSCEVFINYKAKWKILSTCEEYMTRRENRQDSQWSKKRKESIRKNEQIYQIVNDLKNKIRQFEEKLKDIGINFSKLSQIIWRWSYKYWMGPTVMP